jgi:CRP/FNR family transcriptional regulator, cyclic AMP receptor protein
VIDRFFEDAGRRLLLDSLRRQHVVEGSEDLAVCLAGAGELVEVAPRGILIVQDGTDNCIYLIVAGRFAVLVNGREVAVRGPGCHVGEMALIDPSAPRSASVVAIERAVVLKVDEAKFSEIANRFPRLWRILALELADRLRQRNRLVVATNPRPVLFVASSTESLPVARVIQSGLDRDDVLVRVWTDGVFLPSHYPMEDLQRQVSTSDFAVAVLGPDDKVFSRGEESLAPRDNVIGELFLFMGAIGRERTMIVQPRGCDLKIPTDLVGVNPITYRPGPFTDLPALLGQACNEIRGVIQRLGCK